MPKYVERGSNGAVIGAWTEPQYPSQRSLPDTDPELQRYLRKTAISAILADTTGLTVDDIASLFVRSGMYVDRDEHGLIVGAWEMPQRASHELAPLELPELQRFLAKTPPPSAPEGF